MTNLKALRAGAFVVLAWSAVVAADAPVTPALPSLINRGRQTMAAGQHTFACSGRDAGQYLDEVRRDDPKYKPHICYAWAVGLQLSALVAGASVEPSQYRQPMMRYVHAIDAYWYVDHNGLGGYNASIHPDQADRYYDDNAWIALDFCEAYALTGDRTLLDKARKTMAFMLSGEDDKLGGGLYWHEQKKTSKNTCINAPATCCALRLYRLTGERAYLDTAKRLYQWTQSRLQDHDTGLYADSIGLDGKVDGHKYSYNTALMIRAACLFYDQTGDAAYLTEAQRLARAAEAEWFKPDGTCHDVAYFAHMMVEAMLDVGQRSGDGHWADLARRTCDTLWQHNRDPAGLFPEHWDERPDGRSLKDAKLMWQASNARLFFHLAGVLGNP